VLLAFVEVSLLDDTVSKFAISIGQKL